MKRYVVVENPRAGAARSVPRFRSVTFPPVRASRNVMPQTMTTALNRGRVPTARLRQMAQALPYRACIRAGVKGAKCRTQAQKKATKAQIHATRLRNLAKARATQIAKRAGGRVQMGSYGDDVGTFQTNSGRRGKLIPLFRAAKGSRGVPSAARSRGWAANTGGRSMASSAQRSFRAFFAKKRRAGMSAKAIGRAWKSGGRRPSKNARGIPLTAKKYRPTLPKGPLKVVVTTVRKKWKAANERKARTLGRRGGKASAAKRKRKASGNPVYTVFNRPRKAKKRRASANRGRASAMKRWYGKAKKNRGRKGKRKAFRNFGGGLMTSVKSAFNLDVVKEGLAVLVGAVAATGAPSLLPQYNRGWGGVALSIAAAGIAGIVASKVSPQHLRKVAAGGIVVVGLRLVAQFMPRALQWSGGSGVQAGFLLPARDARSGVGGYLTPPPGAISLAAAAGKGRLSGFARAAGEGFRSPRI